ncbi:hypothetical protein SEA_GARDENSTATE_31 [Microbacterium phage GardenState]|uniref:Uncharacterized protein n=2 Tax=Gardenstatevirus TaxID=3425012 RepID=A0A4Y6E8X6_9CAUD|nr:hypothetical protein SEA_IAMGROOT_31 [Microbacterium phage IAmGroot]QOI66943.1 hypothetical protein SEA_GARDENSTATE_31 [Microbacterium phage GardenState]
MSSTDPTYIDPLLDAAAIGQGYLLIALFPERTTTSVHVADAAAEELLATAAVELKKLRKAWRARKRELRRLERQERAASRRDEQRSGGPLVEEVTRGE